MHNTTWKCTQGFLSTICIWCICFLIQIVTLPIGGVQAVVSPTTSSFPDVTTHTYRESIDFLAQRRIVQGYPHGHFEPDWTVTRAEMMKIVRESLLQEQEIHEATTRHCFTDVAEHRAVSYICTAAEKGIVQGYPDNTFQPEQSVTIAEALKIALESFDIPVDTTHTTDRHRYQPYLSVVHHNSLFSQYNTRPDKPMSRGEVAFLVHHLIMHRQGSQPFTYRRDARSPGCFALPPTSTPARIMVDETPRHFLVDVGENYNHQHPARLIFAFHGRTNSNERVRGYYQLHRHGDGNHIIIYPSGLPEEGPTRSRSNPLDPGDQLRDYRLFDLLVEQITDHYCIDMDSIFAVGHSLGGRFANSLACARGDILRGVATVGGSTTYGHTCTGPVAAKILHNPNDQLAPIQGSMVARDQLLQQNTCGPEQQPIGRPESNCTIYTQCQYGAPVIRCPHTVDYEGPPGRQHTYYPHNWPYFAGEDIQNFFMELE